MKRTHLQNFIPLLTLPVMLAVCLALWMTMSNIRYAEVESSTGVWDLRGFDFPNESARVVGAVEYIPNALLTPEEFDARADEIQIGYPQNAASFSTSRIRILLPEGSYLIAGRSIDYSDRVYINGKLMAEIGIPGETKQTSVPDTADLSFMDEPVDGVITIVQQTSNFVHREGGWHDDWRIGYTEIVRASYRHDVTAIVMGCFLALFLVHLALFFILRSYRANLYFSLFCLMWFLRTGVTGVKVFSTLLPWLSWYVKFRVEYLSLPVTGTLIILMLNELFPDILPKWFRRAVYALSAIFIGIFLFADTYFMSWAILGCYAYEGTSILIVAAYFILRFRRANPAQLMSIIGSALFLYAGLRDMFYYSDIPLLPPYVNADLSEISMLIFVFFQMTAMFIGTVHAAEEARAAEQRLTAENAALDRVNRMRNDLTTTVSHEMRTPLAVMSAYAQLSVEAIREGRSDPQTTSNLEMISTEALRLADMATDLLQLSIAQEDDAARTRFDLGGVLRQTAHLCEPMLNKGGNTLTLSVADHLPEVHGNAGELTQVLWNLLSNTAAHTSNGEVTVSAEMNESQIAVTVRDTGEGIAPALLPHVFERRRGDGAGTGVGLAVCREIIEAHGGRITAESEPGQGTAIVFTIPVHEEEPI